MQQVDTALQHALQGLKDKGMRFVQDTWDLAAKQGIVRIHHSSARQLLEMLASLTTIGNAQVRVKTLGTSGILRQAKLKFMKNKTIKKENKRNYHHRV
jgi:RNase P/RNase MRP subunit POP5